MCNCGFICNIYMYISTCIKDLYVIVVHSCQESTEATLAVECLEYKK